MTEFESILVSLFSGALVIIVISFMFFAVKISSIVKILSEFLYNINLTSIKNADAKDEIATVSNAAEDTNVNDISTGDLKLINVDEETAAFIMAIVSHETQISLSKLIFKSIKAIEES